MGRVRLREWGGNFGGGGEEGDLEMRLLLNLLRCVWDVIFFEYGKWSQLIQRKVRTLVSLWLLFLSRVWQPSIQSKCEH